ncbi:MAG: DUF3570 domain-containing protein [Polyangiales bacterium]
MQARLRAHFPGCAWALPWCGGWRLGGLGLCAVSLWLVSPPAHADEAGMGVFVRSDSDDTIVVAPRVSVAKVFNDERTRIDAAYSADIWSSASIDIRTAATGTVTEQRDQLTAGISHDFSGVGVGASYYFSKENDYTSNGVGAFTSQRLAEGSATLEERIYLGYDSIGRSGDPGFRRDARTFSGRLAYTQVFSPVTVYQFAYELIHKQGYQASPYRFVGLGGDGLCNGTAALCVPEVVPDVRLRNAFVAHGRHSLSEDSSLGLGYRFYIDDWGVLSHTAILQFAYVFGEESSLTFRYRFYTQSEADFYRAVYPLPQPGQEIVSVTRDRELSPLFSNRGALAYETLFELGSTGATLRGALAVGLTTFVYADFIGLDSVYAGDVTFALTLEL